VWLAVTYISFLTQIAVWKERASDDARKVVGAPSTCTLSIPWIVAASVRLDSQTYHHAFVFARLILPRLILSCLILALELTGRGIARAIRSAPHIPTACRVCASVEI
jgi:hypothetical protein